uniref:Cytochrome P450 n=1 Tax=Panagrolaimus sp. ES5 TaxID=591445 RepID=A0AC34GJ44_9BILA
MAEQPVVTVNDYKTMFETFVKDGETFNGRSDIGHHMDYIRGGNYGIVFIEGETWKEHRKFAMQIFRNFGMGRNLMEEKVCV